MTVVQTERPQVQFIETLLEAGALSFNGPFKLKSGRESPYFVNCGVLSSGKRVSKAGEALAHAINTSGIEYDVLFGPAYKGIPFVTAAAIGLHTLFGKDVAYAFNRKEVKDHGEGGRLVGTPLSGKRVFIVDDVITAGTAVKESVKIIEEAGGIPVGVAVLLDREEKAVDSEYSAVQQVRQKYDISVVSALKCSDLFEYVKMSDGFGDVVEKMDAYRLEYGAKV